MYELVSSIVLRKISGSIVMTALNCPYLCCYFETPNILKVAHRGDDHCIIVTETFYLGTEIISVSIERTRLTVSEGQTLPLPLMDFVKS